MKPEEIARVCHEVNRAACEAFGDDSQVAWEDAPGWQRESAAKGVLHAQNNPDVEPSDSHQGWLAEKIAAGWTYGPTKDVAAKEHPCMVAFDALPPEQRLKDYLFLTVVRALSEPADD